MATSKETILKQEFLNFYVNKFCFGTNFILEFHIQKFFERQFYSL